MRTIIAHSDYQVHIEICEYAEVDDHIYRLAQQGYRNISVLDGSVQISVPDGARVTWR